MFLSIKRSKHSFKISLKRQGKLKRTSSKTRRLSTRIWSRRRHQKQCGSPAATQSPFSVKRGFTWYSFFVVEVVKCRGAWRNQVLNVTLMHPVENMWQWRTMKRVRTTLVVLAMSQQRKLSECEAFVQYPVHGDGGGGGAPIYKWRRYSSKLSKATPKSYHIGCGSSQFYSLKVTVTSRKRSKSYSFDSKY